VGRIILPKAPSGVVLIDGKLYIDGKYIPPIRGGVAMFDPEFTKFRLYDDDGSESASTALEAQDVDHTLTVDSDQEIQVRMFVQNNDAAGSTDDYRIDYDKNSVGFAVVPTSDTGAGIEAAAAGLTNDGATTNRASEGITNGSGSFDAGIQITDGIGNDTLAASDYTHQVFGIKFIAANVANNDTFDFEFGRPNSMTNTIVPRITISKAAAGAAILKRKPDVKLTHQLVR